LKQLSATNSIKSFANIYSSTDDTACGSKQQQQQQQQVVTEMTGKGRIAAATYQINLYTRDFTMGSGMTLNFFFPMEIQAST